MGLQNQTQYDMTTEN